MNKTYCGMYWEGMQFKPSLGIDNSSTELIVNFHPCSLILRSLADFYRIYLDIL